MTGGTHTTFATPGAPGLAIQAERVFSVINEISGRRPAVADCVLDALDAGEQVFDVGLEVVAAPGAYQLRVCLEPTDRLLGLVVAGGAGDADLAAVKRAFGHGAVSPFGCDTTTIGRNWEAGR